MDRKLAMPAEQFRLTGLSKYVERMIARLATAPAETELRELHRSLDAMARRLDVAMSLQRVSAGQLTKTTRSLRGWVAFLSDWEDLAGYAKAVRIGTPLLEAAARHAGRWELPVRLALRPMRGMYQARQLRDGIDVALPTAAVCFHADDFTAAAGAIFQSSAAAKRQL